VVSLVERQTGYLVLGQLPARTAAACARRTSRLIRAQYRPVRTITADNALHPVSRPPTERAEANAFVAHGAWPSKWGATSPGVFHAARVPC